MICKYCHENTHYIDECPIIICKICKGIGHPQWSCTKKKNNNNSNSSNNNSNSSNNSSNNNSNNNNNNSNSSNNNSSNNNSNNNNKLLNDNKSLNGKWNSIDNKVFNWDSSFVRNKKESKNESKNELVDNLSDKNLNYYIKNFNEPWSTFFI